MADLSKIKVGSTTYNIKDAQAREDISTQSSQIAQKADSATTLDGYGITDAIKKYTLLWENASPTSAFATQDILVGTDLTQYEAFLIIWNQYAPLNRFFGLYHMIGNSFVGFYGNAYRIATISSDRINFGWGFDPQTGEHNDVINAPFRVYGIKELS